ncbi:MAG: ribonuclease HI family protein [bacterium]
MRATLFSDGAARGNPGSAGIGLVIKNGAEVLFEGSAYIGKTTNNIAEYKALIRGLEEALLLGVKEINCFADSELLVKQIKGEYRVKNDGLIPLFNQLKTLIRRFQDFSITHITRDKNKHADDLANRGIDEYHLSAANKLINSHPAS